MSNILDILISEVYNRTDSTPYKALWVGGNVNPLEFSCSKCGYTETMPYCKLAVCPGCGSVMRERRRG